MLSILLRGSCSNGTSVGAGVCSGQGRKRLFPHLPPWLSHVATHFNGKFAGCIFPCRLPAYVLCMSLVANQTLAPRVQFLSAGYVFRILMYSEAGNFFACGYFVYILLLRAYVLQVKVCV